MEILDNNWIEKWFIWGDEKKIPRVIFSGFFFFIPTLIIFIPFIVLRINAIMSFTPRMWFGLISGLAWSWLAPYLIQRWYKTISGAFIELSQNNVIEIKESSKCFLIAGKSLFKLTKVKIIWITFICFLSVLDKSYLKRFASQGVGDIYFWIFIVALLYILYFSSVGIEGVFTTLKLVKIYTEQNKLELNFTCSDNECGISSIKILIRKSTLIFSSGVFFIPILLDYISYSNILIVKLLLYFAIIIFSCFVFCSLYIPTKSLHLYATKMTKLHLKGIAEKYQYLMKEIISPNRMGGTLKQNLIAINLNLYMQIIENGSLFSIRRETLYGILTSIIIPLVTFFFNGEDMATSIVEFIKSFS